MRSNVGSLPKPALKELVLTNPQVVDGVIVKCVEGRHLQLLLQLLGIVERAEINIEDFVINQAPLQDLLSVFKHMMSATTAT